MTVLGSDPIPVDLGDNLVLRFAQSDDIDAVAEFNARITDDPKVSVWTQDLMSGRHPTTQASDFTVVEDTHAQKIVSSMCLISQTWAYGGIPFKLGRPEIVMTDPAYRRRGLVRKQFEVIHALSSSKGELMQAISGIPWFYRQFGYEMAMNRFGTQSIYQIHIPKLGDNKTENYRVRPMETRDHAFIREVCDNAIHRQPFAALRSAAEWDYELKGNSQNSSAQLEWLIIEATSGERLGYVQYFAGVFGAKLSVQMLELKPGFSYLNLMPSILRGLWEHAQKRFAKGDYPVREMPRHQSPEELHGLAFALGLEHPAYDALPKNGVVETKPWAWYIRVPNIVAFLRHVQPALEKHLTEGPAAGYSGTLKLNFYRSGIQLVLERGQITDISDWSPETVFDGDAKFPDLTFLQLLCGRRRFNELADNFADCLGRDDAATLLDNLFPPFTGHVWVLS